MSYNDGIYTIDQYIVSRCSVAERIIAIDAMILAFEDNLMKVALDPTASITDEYQMDDGQMKVRTKFRTLSDIQNAIGVLEAMKQKYVNRYNGRIYTLRSGNF